MSRLCTALTTVSIGLTFCGLASAQTLTVVTPSTHADSKALRDLDHGSAPVHGMTAIRYHHGELPDEQHTPPLGPDQFDPLAQLGPGPLINAGPGTDFEGLGQSGFIPSDNNIAVGPFHIVETTNVKYAVYNKAGGLVTSGFLSALWSGLPGSSCATNNGGDPVVQYDRFADRWILTQLGSLKSPYSQCIAVSKTNDPTGAYSLYSYSFGAALNDYPKFGVWPTATNSAYLATFNLFYGGSGAELCAFDRAAMLAGAANPIGLCYNNGVSGWSYLPSDLDGSTPPLDGTPGYFVDLFTTSSLGVYKLKPNFAAATATLTGPSTIAVAPFAEATDVPQPSTTQTLDPLSDRLMYRLGFRMYGDHEAMAVTHSVATGGVAGARWYELRSPISNNGTFTLFQQGTFAPADGNHRWMGSIAMDQAGNMGLGYSVSGPSRFPSIRYTGRMPGDPAGTMETEASIREGQGSQLGYDRWGDYSSMRIDPSDDCTFWYVNEYYAASASYDWHTRIGSFKFNGCGAPPVADFSLSANPSSLSRVQGAPGSSVITVNVINSFNGSTTLSVSSGCPTGATCAFTTNPVAAGGTSTLNVTNTSGAPPALYNIVVRGDSGSLTHTTTVAFTVTAPASDFTLTLPQNTLTVHRKSSASVAVNLTGGGGPVTLSVTGLVPKLTGTFTPNPVATVPGNSTLKISANPQAQLGPTILTVKGNGGGPGHEAQLTVNVVP